MENKINFRRTLVLVMFEHYCIYYYERIIFSLMKTSGSFIEIYIKSVIEPQ